MENENEKYVVCENEKNKIQKDKQQEKKKLNKKSQLKRERDNYFGFYDDIKSSCHKIVDW